MSNTTKMRTIPEAAKEIALFDPNTCLTEPVLRRMVKDSIIPHVKSGNRMLIDLNSICNNVFFANSENTSVIENKVRKVS